MWNVKGKCISLIFSTPPGSKISPTLASLSARRHFGGSVKLQKMNVMLNPQNSISMRLQFGELNITPRVVARLHELNYTVPELEDAIAEHKSGLDGEPSVYVGTYGNDLDDFEEAYCGEWDSEEDFAQHIVEECYDLERTMGNLAQYFDYEAFARELFMYDYTMGANNNVFRNICPRSSLSPSMAFPQGKALGFIEWLLVLTNYSPTL